MMNHFKFPFVVLSVLILAGCQNTGKTVRNDASGGAASGLSFHICVTPDEVDAPHRLRQSLAINGPGASAGDLRWVRLFSASSAVEGNSLASHAASNLVAGTYSGQIHLLVWNTEAKSMSASNKKSWQLKNSAAIEDHLGGQRILLTLDDRGADMLGTLTEQNINRSIAVVVADRVYATPVIRSKITSNAMITTKNGFTRSESQEILKQLGN